MLIPLQTFHVTLLCHSVMTGTAIASSLMDKQGRKSLLITSFAGMVLSLLYWFIAWGLGPNIKSEGGRL